MIINDTFPTKMLTSEDVCDAMHEKCPVEAHVFGYSVVLLGEGLESLGSRALVEKVCHW